MLWWVISGFFAWLAFREIYYAHVPGSGYGTPDSEISKPFVFAMLFIAAAFAYTPVRYAYFESYLTKQAKILSGSQQATVHCNTMFDTFFDPSVFSAGHANIETGKIVFQHPWCARLMDYLNHPEGADFEEIYSLHMLVHEAMHIRGERNEARADCEAIQRDYRASKLLGIPDRIAKRNSMIYYLGSYQERATQGVYSSEYYSAQCAPGKGLDEKLPDSTWN